MKSAFIKRIISLGIILAMLVSVAACGRTKETSSAEKSTTKAEASTETSGKTEEAKQPIILKYPTYRVGTNLTAPLESKLNEEFKEKFGNEIQVVIEELPSNQAYEDKIKILISSNDLPDVVEGNNGIFDVVVKSGKAIDLTSYIEADPEWKADIGEEAIKFNTRDGKLYSIDQDGAPKVGYFYNKEIFEKNGILPAKTWDEFMANCEKLKKAGVVPLALMTNENAWTTNLLLASIVGTSNESGNKFMNEKHPTSFETPEFINGLRLIQTMLQKYTTKDALGAAYANAANNFLQGKTAMIANGPWMIGDFRDKSKASADFENKVGAAIYPNGGMFVSYWEGLMVCAQGKERQDAAVKFVKYKTDAHSQQLGLEMINNFPLSPKVTISDEFKQKNRLFCELVEATKDAKYKYYFLDTINYSNVIEAFKTLYPELVFNKITPEGMAKKLSEISKKNIN